MALSTRYDQALALAAELHRTQTRKGTEIPYLSHLLSVSALVLEYGGSEDEAIAALLHDAVEDQGGRETLQRIRADFGEAVAAMVAACSDSETVPKPPWRQRKQAYLDHLGDAPAAVILVSCADKLHNARCILADHRQLGADLWARFNAGRDSVLWYYRALVAAFAAHGSSPLVDELDRTVQAIEQRAAGED